MCCCDILHSTFIIIPGKDYYFGNSFAGKLPFEELVDPVIVLGDDDEHRFVAVWVPGQGQEFFWSEELRNLEMPCSCIHSNLQVADCVVTIKRLERDCVCLENVTS